MNIFKKKAALPIPPSVWTNPWHFIAFGFGSGTLPIAPGTFGTLLAIPFYLLLRPLPPLMYLLAVLLITIASIIISHRVSQDIQVHDHPGMCLDEFVGYLITTFYAPHGIFWIVLGFGLFRFFDIYKPWPIRWVDKNISGGWGMILDDILAGVASWVVLQGIAFASLVIPAQAGIQVFG